MTRSSLVTKGYFLLKISFVSLYVLCLFSFLHFVPATVSNNIDGSWQYSIAGLRHSSQHLGKDIFYSYGPLYEKIVTVVHAEDNYRDFIVSNLYLLTIVALNTWVLIRFIKLLNVNKNRFIKVVLGISLLTFILTVTDIDTVFYFSLFLSFIVARKEKSYWTKLIVLFAPYLLSYYKLSFVLPTIIITPLVFIPDLQLKNIIHGIKLSLFPGVVFALIFFTILGSLSPQNFIHFIYYGVLNSLAYNEFMGLSFSLFRNLWLFCGFTLFATILTYFFVFGIQFKKKGVVGCSEYAIIGGAYIVILYFAVKHAVIRNDIHLLAFTPFIYVSAVFIIFSLITLYRKPKKMHKPVLAILSLVFIVAIGAHLVFLHTLSEKDYRGVPTNFAIRSFYISGRLDLLKFATIGSVFRYHNFIGSQKLTKARLSDRSSDIYTLRKTLSERYPGRTVLFYGNTTVLGEMLKQTNTVLYFPYLQNYAAFPPQLTDKLYIDYLENHPDALVLAEETEPSIDERIPAYELNDFFQYLLHNYRVVAQDDGHFQYLFERTSKKRESCSVVATLDFTDGKVVGLPKLASPNSSEYYKLVLDKNLHPAETLLSLLIKSPVYSFSLINPEGGEMKARVTRTTLEHGITINPLDTALTNYVKDTPFKLSAFILHNGLPTTSKYSATIQLCTF